MDSLSVLFEVQPNATRSRVRLSVPELDLTAVAPDPATHSILTGWKAGEAVCQTLFVPKVELQTLKTLCQALFVSKTAPETRFFRPSIHLGCGARP